jgi:hypothetical protein
MTTDAAIAVTTPKSTLPIEWVQTHNPQEVLLMAYLMRQAPSSVRKAIGARLPRVETQAEIGALMAITRGLGRIHQRAARQQLLEMIGDAAIPLEKVELAAALLYAQQEKEQLRHAPVCPPQATHNEVFPLPFATERAGLSGLQRLARQLHLRAGWERLTHLALTVAQGLSFIVGWLGGLVVGGAFCTGLVALAYVLLKPVYIHDWLAFVLDARLTHYIGWVALAVCGWLLPVMLVLLPLHGALGLFCPLRRYVAIRHEMRTLRQIQWDISNPRTLYQRAREQLRPQVWHCEPCAETSHWLFIGLAVLGGLLCVAGITGIVAKLCAGLVRSQEWFWPIVVAITVLGYAICALYQFYDACLEHIDDQV